MKLESFENFTFDILSISFQEQADELLSPSSSCLLESHLEATPSHSDGNSYHLGENYTINPYDVMCGRGKATLVNNGNIIFRQIIATFLKQFLGCKKRVDKQICIAEIIDTVRSSGGHFLKQDQITKDWHDIGDKAAADKIGHSLRDLKSGKRCRPRSDARLVPTKSKIANICKGQKATKKKKDAWDELLGDIDGMFNPVHDEVLDSIDLLTLNQEESERAQILVLSNC